MTFYDLPFQSLETYNKKSTQNVKITPYFKIYSRVNCKDEALSLLLRQMLSSSNEQKYKKTRIMQISRALIVTLMQSDESGR